MVVAYAARSWLNSRVDAPWIMGDEIIYSEMAKSFADGQGFNVREQPFSARTLYPMLISPAWLADSVLSAFSIAKAINAALMTLAGVPLYLWARRLVSKRWAVVAVALLLLMPAYAYTGNIMTESAFLPVFLLALLATARALETPTAAWQLLAIAAVLGGVLIRLQGLILFAVLVTAVLLNAAAGVPRPLTVRDYAARLRKFTLTGGVLLALALVYVGYALSSYGGLSQGLGGYRSVVEFDYSLADGARWTALHAADLVLAVGLLPASAFLVLAVLWLRADARPSERAFACVTAASLLWIIPQAGFFASRYSQRIEERNMFYLEPLLLLALVAWVAHGAPRPPRVTALALAIPTALLVAIPLERLFGVALLSDTFALIPLMHASRFIEGGTDTVRVALALGAGAGALLFLLPRRLIGLTVVAVAGFLGLSAWSVAGALRDQARATRLETHTLNADWIDETVGAEAKAPFIFTPDLVSNSHLLWQTEFWNRSVGDVYGLDASDPTNIPTIAVRVDARGRFIRVQDNALLSPRYVVAQPGVAIAGDEIRREGRLGLFRVKAPLRLESRIDGVYGDGWSGADAVYTNYSSDSRLVRVDVGRAGWSGPDVAGRVTIEVKQLDSGRRVSSAQWVVHSLSKRTFRLKAPRSAFMVEVHVDPTFSPAQYGQGDTRQLGVQVSFEAQR